MCRVCSAQCAVLRDCGHDLAEPSGLWQGKAKSGDANRKAIQPQASAPHNCAFKLGLSLLGGHGSRCRIRQTAQKPCSQGGKAVTCDGIENRAYLDLLCDISLTGNSIRHCSISQLGKQPLSVPNSRCGILGLSCLKSPRISRDTHLNTMYARWIFCIPVSKCLGAASPTVMYIYSRSFISRFQFVCCVMAASKFG